MLLKMRIVKNNKGGCAAIGLQSGAIGLLARNAHYAHAYECMHEYPTRDIWRASSHVPKIRRASSHVLKIRRQASHVHKRSERCLLRV